MSLQNIQDNSEIISKVGEKISSDIEMITEKRKRGQRGPDKMTRKINLNSINNLKQYRKNTELYDPHSSISNENSSNFDSKLFRAVILFFLLILSGIIIWYICNTFKNTNIHRI